MSVLSQSKIIRRKQLATILNVSEVTIWRWERAGHLPPKRRIGPNIVGWLASEIDEWWAERAIEQSRKGVNQ